MQLELVRQIFTDTSTIGKLSDGCILVGTTRQDDQILESRIAFNALFKKLMTALETEQVSIEIRSDAQ